MPDGDAEPDTAELERSGAFDEVRALAVPREVEHPTAQQLELVSTHSQVAALPPASREGLLTCLGRLADEGSGGRTTHRYSFELVLARTPGAS